MLFTGARAVPVKCIAAPANGSTLVLSELARCLSLHSFYIPLFTRLMNQLLTFRYAVIVLLALSMAGCGRSTSPVASSSQDELNRYLDEHPELKEFKEDGPASNGI